MPGAGTRSPDRLTRTDLALLLAAGLIAVVFRLHAYPAPLETDECNYAYFAQRMLAGDRLYVDLWDHQPPGIFALLVLPTAVFGAAPTVYRTVALVLVIVTLAGTFDIARRWFGRTAAWTAALLFAVSSSDPGIAGEGCNREVHMNALLVAAWWLLARGDRASLRRVFAAGLLLGLASTIKTVVAIHWLALLPAVLNLPAADAGGRRGRLPTAAVFCAGPLAVWFATGVYFAATGRGASFVDAVFTYNLAYSATGQGWLRRLVAFFVGGDGVRTHVFGTAAALWIAGAVGLAALRWRPNERRSKLLAGWIIASFIAVCLPGKYWPHYYLLMLPPIVLSAAGLVGRLAAYRPAVSVSGSAVVVIALFATQIPGYLLVEPDRIARHRYRDRMTWARDQARRVAAVTDPQDSIYVWSIDAGYYYYSGRRCASRYTMFGPLVADHPSTATRRRLLVEDLVRNRPRLIIIPFSRRDAPCPELLRFIQDRRYVAVGRTSRMEVLCDVTRPVDRIDWTWPPPTPGSEKPG